MCDLAHLGDLLQTPWDRTEAEMYADKALKSFRRGGIRKAKVFFYAANTYHDKTQNDVRGARELGRKMAEMLKPESGTP